MRANANNYLKCDIESRRSLVRNSTEINGIDFVEVLTSKSEMENDADNHKDSSKDPYRSLLVVRCFHPIKENLSEQNVVIEGGSRIRNIKVLWARRADLLTKVQDEFSKEEKELATLIPDKEKVLLVRTSARGDFSTYVLGLVSSDDPDKPAPGFDELLSRADFSFRVDCQEGFDCMHRDRQEKGPLLPKPNIDYMAKDYASFCRLMFDRLALISPHWKERNPSDMGIALVELLAYVGDQLSYYQDAVATEAYLGTARKRVSIRRHARLLGYHMHDGSNSRAWVFLEVDKEQVQQIKVSEKTKLLAIPKARMKQGAFVDSDKLAEAIAAGAQVFETMHDATLYDSHNEIKLYTWADDQCYLVRGATCATLRNDGKKLKLKKGDLLLFEEALLPHNSPKAVLYNLLDALGKVRSYVWNASSYEPVSEWESLAVTTMEKLYGKNSKQAKDLSAVIADDTWKDTNRSSSVPPEIFVNNAFQVRVDAIEEILKSYYEQAAADVVTSTATSTDTNTATTNNAVTSEGTSSITERALQKDEKSHRHVVRLTDILQRIDPLTGVDLLRVSWDRQDALPFSLCVMDKQKKDGVRLGIARGNIVLADHGHTIKNVPIGNISPKGPFGPAIPNKGPLTFAMAYDSSKPAAHAFEIDPRLALPEVMLLEENGGAEWKPKRDLLHSNRFAREFVVETENDGRSYIRFGNKETGAGRIPAAGGTKENPSGFIATFRTGNGISGNVGAGAITAIVGIKGIKSVRNPLQARGGTEPEDAEHIRQFAPGSFMKQYRAVTEQDYNDLLARHNEIQKARATIRWTGSWHTVFVAIDRIGGLAVDDDFKQSILRYLDAYRLAGYDVEVHAAKYVPLYILLKVRIAKGYFKEHLHDALVKAFGNNAHGFFNPDKWTFGQTVYLSQVYAVATNVNGVKDVEVEAFGRQERPHDRDGIESGFIKIGSYEIARLDNDPDFPENGKIEFIVEDGE